MPKQHFVRIELFIIEVGGKLVEQALVFFSFLSYFITSQTSSKDDNSEDEWINPPPPFLEVKGTGQRNLSQMKGSHVFNEGFH